MPSLVVWDSDGEMGRRLLARATPHGRSPEEEARRILEDALELPHAPQNLVEAIRARFAPLGGVELELPPREPVREPPTFD